MRIAPSNPNRVFPSGDRTIALLMSGGVDSSVVALLLKRQGWDVVGFTLRIPDLEGHVAETGESAAHVAEELEIPHFIVHAEEAFAQKVIAPFLASYTRGLTPNPCADCNKNIKFGLLIDAIDGLALRPLPIATGHYVRLLRGDASQQSSDGGRCYLARGANEAKDQSYFLCDIERERLCRLHFPLSELSKEEVRRLAREAGMAVAERTDSMEICFAAGGDYRKKLTVGAPGDIVDKKGSILGRHSGVGNYTLGQRKGLGIAAPHPLYVVKIDVLRNEIVVSDQNDAYSYAVSAVRPNVLAPDRVDRPLRGKTRSRSPLSPCQIARLDDDTLSVTFASPQFAPAAGQRLVLYDEEDVLVVSGTIA